MLKVEIPQGHLLKYGKKNLRKALRASAQAVAKEARALTRRAGGSGRAYSTPRSMTKGVHYASAPGEPPAELTGALSRNIAVTVRTYKAWVWDKIFYAKFLEVGAEGGIPGKAGSGSGTRNLKATKSRAKVVRGVRVIHPRPFITRALQDHEQEIEKRLADSVQADLEFTSKN